MAIQNVGQGVYVIVPEKVDTQGGKYVSIFTKQREEQWQLAQKQAGFEADVALKSFSEQMKTYRDRVDAMNDQIRDLRKLRERALSDELTAKDKAELASWKLQADRDAKIAARANKPLPSTTKTETTGTAGRGGKGPTLGKVGDADKEIIMGAMAPAVGDVGTALAGVKDARETTDLAAATPEDTDAQNFFVINDLADKRVLATGEDKDTAIAEVLREANAIDPQYAESYARHVRTKDEIETGTAGDRKTTTTRTGGGAARVPEYEFGKEGATPKAGPEIPVESRSQIQDDIDKKISEIQDEIKGLKAPTFETFDYITRAREIASGRFGPTSASPAFGQRNALQLLLRATPEEQQKYLADFRASPEGRAFLAVKTPAADAGRAATTAPTAAAAPTTAEGWASVGVIKPEKVTDPEVIKRAATFNRTPEEQAYTEAKEAWAKSQAAAPIPPVTIPDTAEFYSPFTMDEGKTSRQLLEEAVAAGASAKDPALTEEARAALQKTSDDLFKQADDKIREEVAVGREIEAADRPFQYPFEQRGGETVPFFRKPGGLADRRALDEYLAGRLTPETSVSTPPQAPVTPLAPAESVPEAVPVPPADIRPEAADLMTPDEIQAYKEMLLARRGPSALEVARNTTFLPPARLPSPPRPSMAPSTIAAEPVGTVRVPSGVRPPATPPSIGRYTPGPGLAPVTREPPSTADVAPRTPAVAPPGYLQRPSNPVAANIRAEMAAVQGAEAAETAAAAKKTMTDIEKAGALDTFRGPEKVRETKQSYLLNRLDTAYSLVKKPSKLDRVISSGPGKVAYDLYVANKATGKPFSKTYEMLTIEFAGDRSLMEQAHAVALALDIKDSNTAPGGVK